jgi:DNA-binding transcriptional ArsR family regulator
MPAPVVEIPVSTSVESVAVALEPAHSAYHSLVLLSRLDKLSGLGRWVASTWDRMSVEERRRNDVVMIGLYYAGIPDRSWPSFIAHLDYLDTLSPENLRDRVLNRYEELIREREVGEGEGAPGAEPSTDRAAVLESFDAFLAYLRSGFDEEYIDVEIERAAYAYLIDPPALKEAVIGHLRQMWHKYLAEEWRRVEPTLRKTVEAWQELDLVSMSRVEAAQLVCAQELDCEKWTENLESVQRLIFVPNAHIGPYITTTWSKDVLWMVCGVRLPEGARMHAAELSHADIVVRLDALSDDNRLRILRMISEQKEMRSQEIIESLGLSQSAASRHLMQLSATGFLLERRCEGAKCYRLNQDRIRDTLNAVEKYVLGE